MSRVQSRIIPASVALVILSFPSMAQNLAGVIEIPGKPGPENFAVAQEVAIDEASNRVFVSVGGYLPSNVLGDVAAIDGATGTVIGTIAAGVTPWTLALNPVTSRLYVTSQGGSGIAVVDSTTLASSGTIAPGFAFNGVAVDAAANRVYATQENSNNLWTLDATTHTVLTVQDIGVSRPALLVHDAPRNRLYITNNSAGPVLVYDTQTATVVNALAAAIARVAVDAVNNRLYVQDVYGQQIHVYDRLTESLITTVPVSAAPLSSDPLIGIAYSGETNRIYVSRAISTSVVVLDAATLTTVATLAGGNYGIAINAVTNKVYVAERGTAVDGDVARPGRLYVIDDVLDVAIDIKPGSTPNTINLGSNGVVSVAILSSASFDATGVNPTTVRLAGAHAHLTGKGAPVTSIRDVNGDGRDDLVVQVETEALQLTDTDTQAVLTGETYSGIGIRGSDSVRIVG